MERWEKELRERLDKEVPHGFYTLEAGKMKMSTGKQGYIEFEVAVHRELRNGRNEHLLQEIADMANQHPDRTYEKLTTEHLKEVLCEQFNKVHNPIKQ